PTGTGQPDCDSGLTAVLAALWVSHLSPGIAAGGSTGENPCVWRGAVFDPPAGGSAVSRPVSRKQAGQAAVKNRRRTALSSSRSNNTATPQPRANSSAGASSDAVLKVRWNQGTQVNRLCTNTCAAMASQINGVPSTPRRVMDGVSR